MNADGFVERRNTMKRSPIGKITNILTALLLVMYGMTVLAGPPPQANAKKTHFTGEEIGLSQVPGLMLSDGQHLYFLNRELVAREEITDPRLNGTGYFNYTVAANPMTMTGAYWGSSRIVPDIGGGEWNGHWIASMTPGGTTIKMTVAGSGDYSGLVARLTYTSGAENLQISGYIIEAKGEPDDRPFAIRACRTEKIAFLPCVILDPTTWPPAPTTDPPEVKVIAKAEILAEIGQARHLGRTSNEGLALLDPATGVVTGMGTGTAANGDEVFWVYSGTYEGETGSAEGEVHFCGGTGRFEAAIGGFGFTTQPVLEPTAEEQVFLTDYCYRGYGAIRY
jgi:hypothetical protein